MSHVCIQDNPKVIVGDFPSVVQMGFERHGITTEIFERKKPRYCEYHLTYTALKNWDIGMYMHHAELRLYRGNKAVAYAEYHLNGKGGLALNKWASVESKMNPVIDELLAGYTPESVDQYRTEVQEDVPANPASSDDRKEALAILKEWHEEGLIDADEYEGEKKRILSEL